MSTALAVVQSYGDEDYQALKATVAKGLSDAQFRVFVLAARRLGMDPFARQIVPIAQTNKDGTATMTPQVTIDGLRLIAQRTGQYAGQIGPLWCGKDGVWHDVWLLDEAPVAAKVGVIRRDFKEPLWGVARFKSYTKGYMWDRMPDVMIAKVAESIALRKAFPQELSGVYTGDELPVESEPAPRTVPGTVQHGGRTVVESTGEVLLSEAEVKAQRQAEAVAQAGNEGNEPNVFADEPPAPKWPEIQQRAIAAGISLDDWPAVVQEITRKDGKRAKFTNEDKRAVMRYVLGLEEAQARAGVITVDEPEPEQDNGDADLLKNHPALQGSVRP